MSKKNKSTIIRLGIHSIHNLINQNYGKSYNLYSYNIFLQQYFLYYIKNLFKKNIIIYSYIEIFWLKNLILLNIHYIKKIKNTFLIQKIKNTFLNQKIKIRLYQKNIFTTTTLLLSAYSDLLMHKNITHKKSLLILITILNKTLKSTKIVYTKKGPTKLVLLGYKVQIKGRFENTKNQMAKTTTHNYGKISLIVLNSHLDFIFKPIHTKLGTYSLSIWLYYKNIL